MCYNYHKIGDYESEKEVIKQYLSKYKKSKD